MIYLKDKSFLKYKITNLGEGTYGLVYLCKLPGKILNINDSGNVKDHLVVVKETKLSRFDKKDKDKTPFSYPHDLFCEVNFYKKFGENVSNILTSKAVCFNETSNSGYLLLDYCNCDSLKDLVEYLDIETRIKLLEKLTIQIGSTLNFLHANDYVHNDIKNNNILCHYTYESEEQYLDYLNYVEEEGENAGNFLDFLASRGENMNIENLNFKLADFGVSRPIYNEKDSCQCVRRYRYDKRFDNIYMEERYAFLIVLLEFVTGKQFTNNAETFNRCRSQYGGFSSQLYLHKYGIEEVSKVFMKYANLSSFMPNSSKVLDIPEFEPWKKLQIQSYPKPENIQYEWAEKIVTDLFKSEYKRDNVLKYYDYALPKLLHNYHKEHEQLGIKVERNKEILSFLLFCTLCNMKINEFEKYYKLYIKDNNKTDLGYLPVRLTHHRRLIKLLGFRIFV